ncbi:outer membrane lipoprotein carrier protein LolA [Amphritea opalescens]|uniref:Outer membrane lipoprotein carrier protein LolA n=2 Tax=Amphritea opalescens TaxID=2490544 RepID=A0A430KR64_9GAMM|nr:outer membrane lipoprotein carrier protein LolA [Amphritea opalescens]
MVFSTVAWSADYKLLESLTTAPETLHGQFTQVKFVQALDARFESSGRFDYQRDRSIRWHTLKPIDNLLTLTPRSISNQQGDTVLSRLDSQDNPVVAVFSDIFFGVMTAQWQTLADYFEMDVQGSKQHWTVTLSPIDQNVAQVVARVELSGDELLRKVLLFEATGDQTTIMFLDPQP